MGVVSSWRLEWLTCPPEKPTAITPSSLPAERNFGGIVEGEVILRAYSKELGRMGAASSRRSSVVRSRNIQQYRGEQLSCQARKRRVSRKFSGICFVEAVGYKRSEEKEVKTVRYKYPKSIPLSRPKDWKKQLLIGKT